MLQRLLLKSVRRARAPVGLRRFSAAKAVPPTATTKDVSVRSLSSIGCSAVASSPSATCFYNLSYGELADHESRNREGYNTQTGAFCVDSGKFTGRSPKAKYLVKQPPSEGQIWWGPNNPEMAPAVFEELYARTVAYYKNEVENVYVQDLFCGASKASQRKVRFVTEKAWHSHFVKNMFIRPSAEELVGFEPDFTVINAYGLTAEDWKALGLTSEVWTVWNAEKKTAIIGGAKYGGEMKKGLFAMMHFWLPTEGTLSMHCSANIGEADDVCLFFGLSGTGKTTLSTDPKRRLVGDDEHGWDEKGVFNFEGGCYAKTSKLSRDTEPEIFDAIRANALLENVYVDPHSRDCDYFNQTLTENGRVSYPIEHIDNREPTLAGGHPNNIVFLCCDAFGVLPPVARLTPGQAMYHFVSGYTAKVAGTETHIREPEPNFSPCYGAAFLSRHPMEYAKLMKKKLETHAADCYLVNTGWSQGPYAPKEGVRAGERMSIKATRSCLDAIFDGSIQKATFKKDPLFHFEVPQTLDGVDPVLLDPRASWSSQEAFDEEYKGLAQRFADNIDLYAQGDLKQYDGCGPTNA